MTVTEAILQEIKDAANELGITPITLCQYAVKNGHLAKRLENGGGVTIETAEKLRAYIREHRPQAEQSEETE
jgi:signal recognition particle subunit SEC65